MAYNKLTTEEEYVILWKLTEPPYTGEFLNNKRDGVYICKQCDMPLYRSSDKFDCMCGWVTFDDSIEDGVRRQPDQDGIRTEIVCNRCDGHLGHIFFDEGFTDKETRHCVNSISLHFVPQNSPNILKAHFAARSFWDTEYFFMKAKGVTSTTVGFMGGDATNPTYDEVVKGSTGHFEVVEIEYDTTMISYENLLKIFFENHDFSSKSTHNNGTKSQQVSCIFYHTLNEKVIAERYISILQNKGYKVATVVRSASTFWKADEPHQQYYDKKKSSPNISTKAIF